MLVSGIPQYLGPLDAFTDIGTLAGRSLIVSDGTDVRRSGHQVLQKAASVGYRSSKLFYSGSAEDANYDQSPKSSTNKISKQKWALPFGSKVRWDGVNDFVC
jgi:pleckstrin domain-containing family G protein 5